MTEPLPILGLQHVARTTRDVPRSTAFYRDVLGFREVPRPPFSFGGSWLYRHGLELHLIEHACKDDPAAPIDTRTDHLAFAVEDFAVVERLLSEHGIRYHKQINAGGIPQIFFHDPDGHVVEVGIYPQWKDQGRK